MNDKAETDRERRLQYIDTGKVKIGIYHVPLSPAPMFSDMEAIQRSFLPRSLGSLHTITLPTPRRILRWLMS
jgi:hypothetical protein